MMSRALLALVVGLALAAGAAAQAAPQRYVLDKANSRVGFEVGFGPDRITGVMPVSQASVTLDFDRAANSTVSVALDVAHASASFPFATQAMRGPKVLAAEAFPTLTFESRRIEPVGAGGRMTGDITIRGQTRPITLDATIYRQKGQAQGDLSKLSILLEGSVRRSDFGAVGWSDMVGDEVALKILVRIERAE